MRMLASGQRLKIETGLESHKMNECDHYNIMDYEAQVLFHCFGYTHHQQKLVADANLPALPAEEMEGLTRNLLNEPLNPAYSETNRTNFFLQLIFFHRVLKECCSRYKG